MDAPINPKESYGSAPLGKYLRTPYEHAQDWIKKLSQAEAKSDKTKFSQIITEISDSSINFPTRERKHALKAAEYLAKAQEQANPNLSLVYQELRQITT